MTLTTLLAAADKDTVSVACVLPELPSTKVAPTIDTLGTTIASSSVMVTIALEVLLKLALTGEDKDMRNVSLPSTKVSPSTGTAMVLLVSPGAKLTSPVVVR